MKLIQWGLLLYNQKYNHKTHPTNICDYLDSNRTFIEKIKLFLYLKKK